MSSSLKHRLKKAEQGCDTRFPLPPPPDPAREKRAKQVTDRVMRLCGAAVALMDPGEVKQVEAAMTALDTDGGPYRRWLDELFEGRWRLPEVSPAVMKALLLTRLSPECDDYDWVCLGCGLCYPQRRTPPLSEWKILPGKVPMVGQPPWYDLPCFFPSCPHCGADTLRGTWAHLVLEGRYPWMGLDGYVGPEPRWGSGGRTALK